MLFVITTACVICRAVERLIFVIALIARLIILIAVSERLHVLLIMTRLQDAITVELAIKQ